MDSYHLKSPKYGAKMNNWMRITTAGIIIFAPFDDGSDDQNTFIATSVYKNVPISYNYFIDDLFLYALVNKTDKLI